MIDLSAPVLGLAPFEDAFDPPLPIGLELDQGPRTLHVTAAAEPYGPRDHRHVVTDARGVTAVAVIRIHVAPRLSWPAIPRRLLIPVGAAGVRIPSPTGGLGVPGVAVEGLPGEAALEANRRTISVGALELWRDWPLLLTARSAGVVETAEVLLSTNWPVRSAVRLDRGEWEPADFAGDRSMAAYGESTRAVDVGRVAARLGLARPVAYGPITWVGTRLGNAIGNFRGPAALELDGEPWACWYRDYAPGALHPKTTWFVT